MGIRKNPACRFVRSYLIPYPFIPLSRCLKYRFQSCQLRFIADDHQNVALL